MSIEKLTNEQLYTIGSFDKGNRYTLHAEFETETSRYIRTPSRAWPFSVWKHVKTMKYRKSLTKEQCDKLGIPFAEVVEAS